MLLFIALHITCHVCHVTALLQVQVQVQVQVLKGRGNARTALLRVAWEARVDRVTRSTDNTRLSACPLC